MPTWEGWIADAALALALVAMAVYLWRLTSTLDAVSRRQALQSQRMDALPRAQELADTRVQMAALQAKQEALLMEAHATRASIRRVEDFLMKASRNHDA